MPFEIVRNDIVNMRVDAVVNSANPKPLFSSGVDADIYKKAGNKLLWARRKIGRIAAGDAAVTPAYKLDAKYVIHTVGPVWIDGSHQEEQLLASCYRRSLELAKEKDCESVAFPLISAGNYGFPKPLALRIAVREISAFLLENDMLVYLVVFDRESFALSEKLFKSVSSYIDENYVHSKEKQKYHGGRTNSFIDRDGIDEYYSDRSSLFDEIAGCEETQGPSIIPPEAVEPSAGESLPQFSPGSSQAERNTYVPDHIGLSIAATRPAEPAEDESLPHISHSYGRKARGSSDEARSQRLSESKGALERSPCPPHVCATIAAPAHAPKQMVEEDLTQLLKGLDAGFSDTLLKLIDRSGKKDSEIYKKANVDRKLFSKIRNNADYKPSKSTALAFAFALELDISETKDFIGRAGYALSHSSKFDVIVEYFLVNQNYNVFELNEVLFAFDQPLIGA